MDYKQLWLNHFKELIWLSEDEVEDVNRPSVQGEEYLAVNGPVVRVSGNMAQAEEE